MENQKPLPNEFNIHIVVGILLSLVTCGLYNIYWNYKQIQAMNILLGRAEYNFVHWLLLSIITCGIYHIYYEYKMGGDLYNHMKSLGMDINPNLPVTGLVLSCLGLSVIADAAYQLEFNRLAQ